MRDAVPDRVEFPADADTRESQLVRPGNFHNLVVNRTARFRTRHDGVVRIPGCHGHEWHALVADRTDGEWKQGIGPDKFQRASRITAPLAVRLALPAYSNEIVSMLKSTALASTVTLMEMTGVARTIVADTFAPYEIFIAATIIYLVLVWIIQTGFTLIETAANRHVRKT